MGRGLLEVAHRDAGDLELEPGAGGDRGALRADQLDQRGADVAAAEHADAHDRTIPSVVAHGAIVEGRPKATPNGLPASSTEVGAEQVVERLAPHDLACLRRRPRTRPPVGGPCCSWSPSSARTRR